MSDINNYVKILAAKCDADGDNVTGAAPICYARDVDWAGHISAALVHMDRIRSGDVLMFDADSMMKLIFYIEQNLEVLISAESALVRELFVRIMVTLDHSHQYTQAELFRVDDPSKLKPIATTFAAEQDMVETMARQAAMRARKDKEG